MNAARATNTSGGSAASRSRDNTYERMINREEFGSNPRRCSICSFQQRRPEERVPIYHRHFSSLFLRTISGVNDNTPYLCPSCMRSHAPYSDDRIRIVVSDSSLHQFFAPSGYVDTLQYRGDSVHIDYLTIAGADIGTLIDAFRLEYLDNPPSQKPLDVVMVAGYEDLVEGHPRGYIIHQFHTFAHMIMEETRERNLSPREANSVAIASLAYPPQLAWLPDNGPLPYSGYYNNWDKITWLNEQIARLNTAYLARFPPKFHTYGIRTATRTWRDKFGQISTRVTKSHRWEHWQGTDPASMLHLTYERRFKMGIALNNYFLHSQPQTG